MKQAMRQPLINRLRARADRLRFAICAQTVGRTRLERLGLVQAGQEYVIRDVLPRAAVVVDCGTGPDADLSLWAIWKCGARCHAFEPTRRHAFALSLLQERYRDEGL